MEDLKEVQLNSQQIELLETLLHPLVEDESNSNYTKIVAIQILKKLEE